MITIFAIIFLLLFIAATLYLIKLLSDKRKVETQLHATALYINKCETDIKSITSLAEKYREENLLLRTETARLQERLDNTTREIDIIKHSSEEERKNKNEMRELAETHFKILAHEIMTTQTAVIREQNQHQLDNILNPLKENIDRFRKDVTECYSSEARERFSLQQHIKELIEANAAIGKEARELTTALKGNSKVQGDWGELVLETILENSGLQKGEEFFIQVTTDDNGKTLRDEQGYGLRPDVIIKYPGADGGVIVIDSKVSLNAFVEYVNAETDEKREQYARQHITSVTKHINELAGKKYQEYIGKSRLDFVMMFIPNEAAYAAALSIEPTLWQKAYDKQVLLVSPTQLVGSLRLIKQLWTQDRQAQNAFEIAKKSGAMYDKFVGFIADMEKIERALTNAHSSYKDAMNKLRDGKGSLIGRAEKLRQLGISNSKNLSSNLLTDDLD